MTETLDPLVIGTTLLERYTIVQVLENENGVNTYRVAEMRACSVCGVENEGGRTTCGFCGNDLPAARTMLLTERSTPTNGERIPASFELDNLTYAFARDADVSTEPVRARLQLHYAFLSDPGLARGTRGDPNEDSVLALHLLTQFANAAPTVGLFIIADGVGGADAGEVASELAIQHVAHEILARVLAPAAKHAKLTDENVRAILQDAIARANAQVLEYAQQHNVPLGSTVTLVLVLDELAYIVNVGDSRTYLYRDNALTQISRDHSYVAQLSARGDITSEEARTHPQRNIILKSLGDVSGYAPDIFPLEGGGIELRAGDQILLCSDGLWEMVSDQEMENVLANHAAPAQSCAQLVSFANAAGGIDNITVIVLQIQ